MLVQNQIVLLLNELLGQSAKLRKGGLQAVYFCPSCNHYKRKLEVNLETGQWHCWTCDIKGAYLGSLLSKVNASASQREQMVKLTGDLRLRIQHKSKSNSTELTLPQEFIPFSKAPRSVEYKNAAVYLKKRGIRREDILRYNIGYCEEGDYAFHIIIPSYDAKGTLNFFIGRRYYDVEGIISHKKPETSMDIIGFESFINYDEPLNLCEGAFDGIAIRNNAVPLFGKYPSKKLCEQMIYNKVNRVNIILDDDALADAIKNYRLIKKRVPNIDIHIVSLKGKDPSSVGFLQTHKFIKESVPFTDADLMAYELKKLK